MKGWRAFAGLGALALVLTPLVRASDEGSETTRLTYKQLKNWQIVLPAEQWTYVDDAICFENQAGDGFYAERTGPLKLEVDTNGDGGLDDAVKGVGGQLKLRGKTEAGDRFTYAVRIRPERSDWVFASAGAMHGKLNGIQVRFFDQNNNGIWNEFGVDAMTVGATDGASFLSRVVSLNNELFELALTDDGSEATITPWKGESGVLDVAEHFDSRGSLVSAIIQNGDLSFNVARDRAGVRVPAGEYGFVYGLAKKGEETAEIRRGRMVPIVVRPDVERDLAWGGPISAEVDYTVFGSQINVSSNLRYYGKAGEEYTRFQPDAKSPKILVYDAETGELLDSGRFAGC